jgi:hypothetical protein
MAFLFADLVPAALTRAHTHRTHMCKSDAQEIVWTRLCFLVSLHWQRSLASNFTASIDMLKQLDAPISTASEHVASTSNNFLICVFLKCLDCGGHCPDPEVWRSVLVHRTRLSRTISLSTINQGGPAKKSCRVKFLDGKVLPGPKRDSFLRLYFE